MKFILISVFIILLLFFIGSKGKDSVKQLGGSTSKEIVEGFNSSITSSGLRNFKECKAILDSITL